MPITSNRDQRCGERILVNRAVEINSIRNPEMKASRAKLLDLSFCGIGVISNQAYQPDEALILTFSLPGYEGDQTLSIQAKVIHTQPVQDQFLTGLVFPDLNPHQSLVIKAFVNFHQRFHSS